MRKRGKKHSTLAVVPLGMKRSKYALDAHAALLALGHNVAKESHLVDLYTLAELCMNLSVCKETHIRAHCVAVKRMCNAIYNADYKCGELQYIGMRASVALLLDWFDAQPNARIAKTALQLAGRINRA